VARLLVLLIVIPDLLEKASLKYLPQLFFSFVETERASYALNLLGGPIVQLIEDVMSSSNHPPMAYSPVGGSESVPPSENSTPTQVN
jgi:hypothetical protein